MKSFKMKDYILLHTVLLMFSFCSVFSKLAAGYPIFSLQFCFFYGVSIFILGVYALLWQQLLKKFSLTTAFLNKAVSIIWGIVWGALFFEEIITLKMVLGAIIVFVGVSLVVFSDE